LSGREDRPVPGELSVHSNPVFEDGERIFLRGERAEKQSKIPPRLGLQDIYIPTKGKILCWVIIKSHFKCAVAGS
jgi:hypothetical protein